MTGRKLMRYALYKAGPAWRLLPDEERALHKKEFAALFAGAGVGAGLDEPVAVHSYSTVGLRADADFCLWEIADGPEPLQDLQARINATALGRHLIVAYSFLAMSRPSMYTKDHKHQGQEADLPPGPVGGTYLFVYPMDKLRPWYRLPYQDRRRIMGEHFKIGHRYPTIKIHTGYSFGIDDQEFVVAFEGDSVADFLELVMELRESESSSYTARDVPIFLCIKSPLPAILNQLDGAS